MKDSGQPSSIFTAYNLERPVWLDNTWTSKGIDHDRQALGIILRAGETIRFRATSELPKIPIYMDLLNDTISHERYPVITPSWTTITVNYDCVPFVSTPFGPSPVQVEYTTSNTEPLPTHLIGSDTNAFLALWDQYNSPFALIQTTYADLLVPAFDKQKVKELHQLYNLTALYNYYDGIFELFNSLCGLHFTNSAPTDKNIRNRYFIKADKRWSRVAFYWQRWVAQDNITLADCFLDIRPENWCSIHEIGHGYQGIFMSNSSVRMGEIWNNIYAACYQNKVMGNSVCDRGWMYGSGNKELIYSEIQNLFTSSTPLSAWPNGRILFLLMLMIDKTGEHSFAAFNRKYREICNQQNFKLQDYPAMDVIADIYGLSGRLDITGLMQRLHTPLSDWQAWKNIYRSLRPATLLYTLVEPSELKAIQDRLNLRNHLALVDCIELKPTGIKSNLTLVMSEQFFQESEGQAFLLKDGSGFATPITVSSQTLKIPNLPIGTYTLLSPSARHGKRKLETFHMDVKQNSENETAIFHRYEPGAALASQKIDLIGLGSIVFATVTFDAGQDKIIIDVIHSRPHAYYTNITYAEVTVEDANGFRLFHIEIPGTDATLTRNVLQTGPSCTIKILHKEKNVQLTPQVSKVIDQTTTTNTLEITPQGLINKKMNTHPGETLKSEIAKAVAEIQKSLYLTLHTNYPLIDDIYRAINTFQEPERTELIELYRNLNPYNLNPASPTLRGHFFNWHLYGISNVIIATIMLDLTSQTVTINRPRVLPHHYFNDIYVAIWVRSANGEVLHCQELIGNAIAEPPIWESHAFAKGSTVGIFHQEPSRSVLTNVDTNQTHTMKIVQVVRFMEDNVLQI